MDHFIWKVGVLLEKILEDFVNKFFDEKFLVGKINNEIFSWFFLCIFCKKLFWYFLISGGHFSWKTKFVINHLFNTTEHTKWITTELLEAKNFWSLPIALRTRRCSWSSVSTWTLPSRIPAIEWHRKAKAKWKIFEQNVAKHQAMQNQSNFVFHEKCPPLIKKYRIFYRNLHVFLL